MSSTSQGNTHAKRQSAAYPDGTVTATQKVPLMQPYSVVDNDPLFSQCINFCNTVDITDCIIETTQRARDDTDAATQKEPSMQSYYIFNNDPLFWKCMDFMYTADLTDRIIEITQSARDNQRR